MFGHRLQAAWVIARRDFVAVVFSKAFVFFLLGPLFPVVVGYFAGSIGANVAQSVDHAVIGVAMPAPMGERLAAARAALADQLDGDLPDVVVMPPSHATDPALILRTGKVSAVVTGTLDAPVLTGTRERVEDWRGVVGLLAARARAAQAERYPPVATHVVSSSAAKERSGQVVTAQAGQLLLFMLTMLLAGMVLSNLVEEKANKIIEVLAASIPLDAMFLGKLFAMLAVSTVGIAVWATGYGVLVLSGVRSMQILAAPAVGWPLFLGLDFAYFAMAYLLLGAMFLTIGAMANTVREVQTLSMPATMLQLIVFFFSSYALARPGTWVDMAARIFPVSSPYAMLAQAAQHDALWPHLLALGWQGLWVAVMVRGGAMLFRRTVMKSGPARPRRKARR